MAAFARKRVVLNDKGVAVWFVLLIIVFVFLPFMVLTIDMAYVYYTRGQLHNAADAAALAGVSGIDDTNDLVQAEARTRARLFASKNGAAGEHVLLKSNGSNTLSDTNDITVGNWNGTTSTYTPNIPPINAVQVVARRTENRQDGEFGLMFGFAIGRSFMNIGGAAVASLPARAEAPVVLCMDTCTSLLPIPADGVLLYWDPAHKDAADSTILAWTALDGSNTVSTKKDIEDPICEKKSVAACGKKVYTKMGVAETARRMLRCAFKDPTYDQANKVCTNGSTSACGDEVNDTVASWTVIVPIVKSSTGGTGCPPSKQGAGFEPYEIVRYAEITITDIYPGSESKITEDCKGAINCLDYDVYNFPLDETIKDGAVRISEISCVDCPEADMELLGRTPALVR